MFVDNFQARYNPHSTKADCQRKGARNIQERRRMLRGSSLGQYYKIESYIISIDSNLQALDYRQIWGLSGTREKSKFKVKNLTMVLRTI